MKFTIGADPEVFLVNKRDQLRSAIFLPGSKEMPFPAGDGIFIHPDNVAAEFNIPPCKSAQEFIDNIQKGLSRVQEFASEQNLFLKITASASFPRSQLRDPRAKEFGCEPDYNAWDALNYQNPRPCASDKSLRSCGGHIHVGSSLAPLDIVRSMDLFLGCPSIELDKDNTRRNLYGKAGAHRVKPYGVEYRVLSNFWVASPESINWAYTQTEKALQFVDTYERDYLYNDKAIANTIQQCINNGDLKALNTLRKEFNL